MTMRDGKVVYVRDGRTFDPGLGGGLIDVARGNAAAEAAANEYHDRNLTGLAAAALGACAILGGSVWLAETSSTESGQLSHQATVPLLLVGAGVVAMIVGFSYAVSAQTYQWDAINLFNDGVGGAPVPPPSLAPPSPFGYQAKASLRMDP
jgi:hypothetical protein